MNKYIAEFIGTFFLVLTVGCTVIPAATGVIAPLAIGLLIKWSGSYVPGFALGSIVLLTGLPAYWLIVGELKSRAA